MTTFADEGERTSVEAVPETLDPVKLEEFVGRFAGDLGAVLHAATVLIGDQLGLYRAMADGRWLTPEELAEATGTHQRYVREWLAAQAASGYAAYDAATSRFRLTPEQAFALTSEENPLFIPGGVQLAAATIVDVDLIVNAFRTGAGVGWGEHHPDLVEGTLRFFRPNYVGNLGLAQRPAADRTDGVSLEPASGGVLPDAGPVARGAGHIADQIVQLVAVMEADAGRLAERGKHALVLE
jgi:hypothetical protein